MYQQDIEEEATNIIRHNTVCNFSRLHKEIAAALIRIYDEGYESGRENAEEINGTGPK